MSAVCDCCGLIICSGLIRQEEERRRREEEMMIRQREMEEQMRRQREENYSRMGYMDPVSETALFPGLMTVLRDFQSSCMLLRSCSASLRLEVVSLCN